MPSVKLASVPVIDIQLQQPTSNGVSVIKLGVERNFVEQLSLLLLLSLWW